MIKHLIAKYAVLFLALLIASCTFGPGGGGSEVVGYAVNSNGKPVIGYKAKLHHSSYLAFKDDSLAQNATVDSTGQFRFTELIPGDYTIEITNDRDSSILVETSIPIPDTTIFLDSLYMKKMSSLNGDISSQYINIQFNGFVAIYGTEYITPVEQNGTFTFEKVPSGNLRLIISPDTVTKVYPDTVFNLETEEDLQKLGNISMYLGLCNNLFCDTSVVRYILDNSDLKHIPLNSVIKITSDPIPRVTTLDLHGLGISSLREITGKLSALQELNLSDNKLEELPMTLNEIKGLKKLLVSNNLFKKLAPKNLNFPSLEILSISGNSISSSYFPSIDYKSLKVFDLSNNPITVLDYDFFQIQTLEELYCNNCQISVIPDEIRFLKNLRIFSISNNRLYSISENIGELQNLKRLDLSSNVLTAIPSKIGNLTNCTDLYLNANTIIALPDQIANLQSINILMLGSNYICQPQSSIVEEWADRFDPGWRLNQICFQRY